MSLIPTWFDDDWDRFDRYQRPSSRYVDRYFDELAIAPRTFGRYVRPWRNNTSVSDTGSTVTVDKDKFQVSLDVQQFSPSEITVKSGDHYITVEGKHEEKQDEQGYISRHFTRKYLLPKGYDESRLNSNLSSDGMLTISAPSESEPENKHRSIPVQQTGQPSKAVEGKK